MQDYTTAKTVPSFAVFDDPTPDEIEHLVENMRREDLLECAAWNLTPEDGGQAILSCDHCWVVYQHDLPVFILGIKQGLPGSYFLGGFASRHIRPRTFLAFADWVVDDFLPHVFGQLAIRRLEAFVPVQSQHSVDWLMGFGMRHEGTHHGYVNDGDQFFSLAYTVSDHDRINDDVLVQQHQQTTADWSSRTGFGDAQQV